MLLMFRTALRAAVVVLCSLTFDSLPFSTYNIHSPWRQFYTSYCTQYPATYNQPWNIQACTAITIFYYYCTIWEEAAGFRAIASLPVPCSDPVPLIFPSILDRCS